MQILLSSLQNLENLLQLVLPHLIPQCIISYNQRENPSTHGVPWCFMQQTLSKYTGLQKAQSTSSIYLLLLCMFINKENLLSWVKQLYPVFKSTLIILFSWLNQFNASMNHPPFSTSLNTGFSVAKRTPRCGLTQAWLDNWWEVFEPSYFTILLLNILHST
jgi:hypothetical protein